MNYLTLNNYIVPKNLVNDILVDLQKNNSPLYYELKGEIDNWQQEKVDKDYILNSKEYWSKNFEITELGEEWWEVKHISNHKVVSCTTKLMAYKIAFMCQEIKDREPKLVYKFRNYKRVETKVKYLLGKDRASRYFK